MSAVIEIAHVVAAVFVVGPLAVLPMLGMRAVRTGDRAAVRALARSTTGFAIGAALVVVLGFGTMSLAPADDHLTLGTPWIVWSIALATLALLLEFILVIPAMFRAARTDATSAGSTGYALIAGSSGWAALLFVATAVLMVARPA